jgi:hypothetical protein
MKNKSGKNNGNICFPSTASLSSAAYVTFETYSSMTVKVKLTLEQAMKGQRGSCTFSSISALDGVGSQRHASALLPPEKRPSTHWTGGWVGSRVGLNG